jgi:small subunit ribosomal protein S20
LGSKGHKSAQKVARGSIRRQARNKTTRSQLKTEVAKAEKLIAAKDAAAKDALKSASSALDKAVGKKNIHANAAARKKSRLMKKLNKGAAPAKAA